MTEAGDPTLPAGAARDDGALATARATAPPRYELGDQLGVGGMAVVWAAHDRALDRAVAFKVLHDRFLGADHQERLAAEARAMARLSHPNVVAVYDVGERDGRTFVAMEQVGGGSLADWVDAPRPWPEVVAVFRAAGAGLAAAHAAGIVHRDVKPSNILVGDDGRARVADFGVATDGPPGELGGADLATTVLTAGINGTPAYMAPERLRGRRADAASDQFSFAVALYEVLHGRRPFIAATIDGLAAAADQPPPPLRPLPRWLHAVVVRGVAADPERRFPSIAALVAALGGGRRRRRMVVAAAIGALAIGGGAGALAASGDDGARSCPAGAAALHGAWDDEARARVAAGFATSARPYAAATGRVVVGQLDRYAEAWIHAHDAACAAPVTAGPRSPVARDVRLRCLGIRADGLRQLVAALARIDDGAIDGAIDGVAAAVDSLPAIGDCDDAELAAMGGGGAGAAFVDVVAARVALATGQLARARELAADAADDARARGDRAVAAEALVVRARTELRDRRGAAAVDGLTEAAELVRAAGPRPLLVESLVELALALPGVGRRPDGLRALGELEAEASRVHDPARLVGVLAAQAVYFERARQHERALGAYDRALSLIGELHGADALQASPLEAARAQVLRELDRVDEALAAARRGVALARQLGEDHPDVGRRRRELATTLAAAGDEKAANVELVRARAVLRAALGPDDEEVAALQNALALSLLRLGEPAGAVDHLEAAVATDARRTPSKLTAARRSNLGMALVEVGRATGAVPVLREALTQIIGLTGEHHVDAVRTRRLLARALAANGRHDDALAELNQARTSFAIGCFGDAEELARARRDEAAVLRTTGDARAALIADQGAWTIVSARRPPGHRERGETLRALAEDHLALRDPSRAAALAESAIAELTSSPPFERATARWVLARALWAIGRRDEAVAMAGVARADASEPTAVAIDAWLAAR